MLAAIAGFELRYQLKNPVFWVAVLIFFLLGFGLTASENVSLGTPGSVHENAPYAIAFAMAIMSLFYLFVITSFVANAIVRDDATGFGPIIRSTRITRGNFVFGRFAGGLIIALLGYLALPLGMALGVIMPWVDAETVGPGGFAVYAWHFLIIAMPNIFLASALLFALATTTRSMLASYIGVIVFVMAYTAATSLLGSRPEYQDMLARFEPFGIGALGEITRYWTASEMNSRLLPLTGNLLFNRVLVMLAGAALLALAWWRFAMTERAPSRRRLRKLARADAKQARAAAVAPAAGGGDVRPSFGPALAWMQFVLRLKTEIVQVLKSPGLVVLVLLGIGQTIAILWFSQTAYGTSSYPLTADVISNVQIGFTAFLLIIAVFYGGELVWRERDRKVSEIIDASPVPGWRIFVPKILAIFAVLLIVNLAAMLTGIFFQLVKGGESPDLWHYLAWFVLPLAVDMLLLAILSVFVQVLSPNKYIGWAILLVWFIATAFLSNMGYTDMLYGYGRGPRVPLSDINGAGQFWIGDIWAKVYWLCFAAILLVIAHLIWPRGSVVALRPRLAQMRARLGIMPAAIAALAFAGMIGSGIFIYHNIKELNTYRTADEREQQTAQYEKKYLKYENLPQPAVTAVKFDVQLYPHERRMDVTGHYDLRNDTAQPIRTLHVRQSDLDVDFPVLTVSGAKLQSYDKPLEYRIYCFATPLAPGAAARLDFKSVTWRRGFQNGAPDTDIVDNGTFVNNGTFAPVIGMDRGGLLNDRTKRRRQGLSDELRPAKLEDRAAQRHNYIHADWVTSDITVTTAADQTPVAPGNRISDITRGGRRTAHFVSTAPILNFFAIQSARYALAQTDHNGIRLSVYYHPAHGWNVPKMQRAMATALDYYRTNFGPYQFDYARIIEFPGYQSFAQAFAGTMPYSESIGFAADVRDPDKIDYVTYVTAHELAHQYWAHQVVGADMQGGTLSSETLAQYSALMVMKKIYGPDKIRRFLKYELDGYLGGRKGEVTEELPLIRVENQQYIHYRKGSLAMYLLQERLGEAAVNRALANFVAKYRFKGAPYQRSTDLIDMFRQQANTPQHQALITDLFEKITVYDLKASKATVSKSSDGEWTTRLSVTAHKYYADGKGVETETPLSENIEVGAFTERPGQGSFDAGNVLEMKRQPIRSGQQVITLKTRKKPLFAGIDPYNFYIDRNSDDNVTAVE